MSEKKPPPALVDEFDAYGRVFKEIARYRRREWFFGGLVVIFAASFLISALQPPVVIVKDNTVHPPEAPKILRPGDAPPIRAVDVEKFFHYAVRRRWGWSSLTAMRDLDEVDTLLTPKMSAAFRAYVNAKVTPEPTATNPNPKPIFRVNKWIAARIDNRVSLPLDAVECIEKPEEGWFCQGFGRIETVPMAISGLEQIGEVRKVEFRAKIHPIRYSEDLTPWGMVFSYLDAVNRDD